MPRLKNPVDQKIWCKSCLIKEISFEQSEEANGRCEECDQDVKDGRITCY